jgi:hypothetical protein
MAVRVSKSNRASTLGRLGVRQGPVELGLWGISGDGKDDFRKTTGIGAAS